MDQMPPPPPKLRTIREQVWIAQSDLFLDTDVRLNYAYVARVTAGSPYSLEELEAICRDEVAPIVESNLLDIAGEWAGFPDDWLIRSITERLATHPPVPYPMDTDSIKQWHAVAHLVRALRALPPEIRDARVQLWHSLRGLFLERNEKPPANLPDGRMVDYVIREELWPAFGVSVDAYRQHNPRMYPSPAEIHEQTALWLAACPEP